MFTKISSICEDVLDSHGGRRVLENIRTKYVAGDKYLFFPSVTQFKLPSGVIADAELRRQRMPLLPQTQIMHLFNHRDDVKLRVEVTSDYGQAIILIKNNQGIKTVKLSPEVKKRFIEDGNPEGAKDVVTSLTEGAVRGNLLSFVWETPIAFLLDYGNRNANYKGIREATSGLTEIEKGPCHVIQFTGLHGSGIYELEVDIKEMLCRRLLIPMGMRLGEYVYSDYRRVGNVMAAHDTKFIVDNNTISIGKVRDIKFNVSIPRATFST